MDSVRDAELRMDAHDRLKKLGFIPKGGRYTDLLAPLCGWTLKKGFPDNFNDGHRRVCQAILGPHGYAYVKARMIQLKEEGLL